MKRVQKAIGLLVLLLVLAASAVFWGGGGPPEQRESVSVVTESRETGTHPESEPALAREERPVASSQPATDPPRSVSERLKDETELQALRERWATVFAQNRVDRSAEFESSGIGTTRLIQTLESAGVLLEQIPPELADSADASEVERAAIANLLTTSASRRVRYGRQPFAELGESARADFQSSVASEGICFPPEYLIGAMGGDPERLDPTVFLRVRAARIDYLRSLAVLLADRQCRLNSTIELGIEENFGRELSPSSQTPLLDPSFEQIDFHIRDQHQRYWDAVAGLLRD